MTTMPQPADPTASFTATYDAWNRLVKLVDDTTTHTIASYQYDGAKRRVVEQTYTAGSLEETRHCYFTDPSKWQVIEERLDSSTDPEQQHIWGLRYIDDILLRDRDTTSNGTLDERLYGLQDSNWNVTCLINTNCVVQERFAYSAYGQPDILNAAFARHSSSTSNWDILYSGYSYDANTGLFTVRNRTYHHTAGSWVQRDPLGLSEGLNMYRYVYNTPLLIVDTTGTNFFDGVRDWICTPIDNSPCLAKIASCVCSIVDLIDVIVGLIPQASLLLNIADCACEVGAVWIVWCTKTGCPWNEAVDQNSNLIVPALIGCVSDFLSFADIDVSRFQALFELVIGLMSEMIADKTGESGIQACYDLAKQKGPCF